MIFIYKNKGILIPVFLITPFIAITVLSGVLERNVGGIFASNYDKQIIFGISLLISGIWTFFKGENFIKINGLKEKIEINNHFFYISMKMWSYIMLVGGILLFIVGIIETFS